MLLSNLASCFQLHQFKLLWLCWDLHPLCYLCHLSFWPSGFPFSHLWRLFCPSHAVICRCFVIWSEQCVPVGQMIWTFISKKQSLWRPITKGLWARLLISLLDSSLVRYFVGVLSQEKFIHSSQPSCYCVCVLCIVPALSFFLSIPQSLLPLPSLPSSPQSHVCAPRFIPGSFWRGVPRRTEWGAGQSRRIRGRSDSLSTNQRSS